MKALLKIEEAAKLTSLSVKTLYTYAENEKVPHIKLGRRVLFEEDKLEEWVTSCRVNPSGDVVAISANENIADEDEFERVAGEPA